MRASTPARGDSSVRLAQADPRGFDKACVAVKSPRVGRRCRVDDCCRQSGAVPRVPAGRLRGIAAPLRGGDSLHSALQEREIPFERGELLIEQGVTRGGLFTLLDARCASLTVPIVTIDRGPAEPRLRHHLEERAPEEHLVTLGRGSVRERVAYLAAWLLERARATCVADGQNRLPMTITQAQIADMRGLSLVNAHRTIKALGAWCWCAGRQGSIHVADLAATAEYAHFDRANVHPRPCL